MLHETIGGLLLVKTATLASLTLKLLGPAAGVGGSLTVTVA